LKDGQEKNGGIILIRELSKSEIKEIEDYIQTLKGEEEYKNYFYGSQKQGYADRGFLLNDSYYCDVEIYNNIPFIGMFRLPNRKNYSLKSIICLFDSILKEYGCIGVWRTVENKQVESLHNHIKRRYKNVTEIKKDNLIIIIVKEVTRCK
jgi:hypothetical protein